MSFNLRVPKSDGSTLDLNVKAGEIAFVLGANGSGKSTLMHHFSVQNYGRVRKVAAHRQTWMSSSALDLTPAQKEQTEQNIINTDRTEQSRWRDHFASQRASITIFELIDAQNVRARAIAEAVDRGDGDRAREASKAEAPLATINRILFESGIPIEVTVEKNEHVMARKDGGAPYSAAELSDGERNALLVAGNVLTAPPNHLIIIDEPERHLHRAIIAPLLSQLIMQRPDCAFVISTHDYELPFELRHAKIALVRHCNRLEGLKWDIDLVDDIDNLDEDLKRDLVGSRRKILFVEGTTGSLDKNLYSVVFPQVSVVPKGSCREVRAAVHGLRSGDKLHWIEAFGLIDGDARSDAETSSPLAPGLYSLPFYSVEALYCHPILIEALAERQAETLGSDASSLLSKALRNALDEVGRHSERLSEKAAKRQARNQLLSRVPNDDELLKLKNVDVEVNGPDIRKEKAEEVSKYIDQGDWLKILKLVPIRECGAEKRISDALGFQSLSDYQSAVRQFLSRDTSTRKTLRKFFGELGSLI